MGQLTPVDLEAAVDHVRVLADRRAQIGGPALHRRHGGGRRSAQAQDADSTEPAPLDDRVRAVRGAEHGVRDECGVDARCGEHRVDRVGDAVSGVCRGRALDGCHHGELLIEDHGVGVRSPDVDPDPVSGVHAASFCWRTRSSTGVHSTS